MRPIINAAVMLLTFCSSLVTAQQVDNELILDFDRAEVNWVHVPYRIKEIISLGEDNASIGVGYQGMDYVPHLLFFREGRNRAFNDMLRQTVQNQQAPEAVLRITGLTANQQIGFSAVRVKVEAEAELLLEQENGHYLTFGPVRRVQMESGAGRIERAAPQEIADLLQLVLNDLSELALNGVGGIVTTKGDLRLTPIVYPINKLNARELPNGIFHTYMDFRAGIVDTTYTIEQKSADIIFEDESGVTFRKLNFDRPETIDKSVFRQIWGVQHEGVTAINLLDGKFYNLDQKEDGNFYTRISPSMLTTAYKGAGSMGVAFGLLGSLSTVAVNRMGGARNITYFDYDLASGLLKSENSANDVIGGLSSLFITSSHFSKKKYQLNIKGVDGEMIPLYPDGLVELGDSPSFTFQIGDESPITETIPESVANETIKFARILIKGNGSYRVDWSGGDSARVEVDKLR